MLVPTPITSSCGSIEKLATSDGVASLPDDVAQKIKEISARGQADTLEEMGTRNARWFDIEIEKLEHWAEDRRATLKAELDDLDESLKSGRKNARTAGVSLVVERQDVRDLEPLDPAGLVLTNPPYGVRVDPDPALYDDVGRVFRRMRGHTVALLGGTPAIARAMRQAPERWWTLYNGPIECRLLVYVIP